MALTWQQARDRLRGREGRARLASAAARPEWYAQNDPEADIALLAAVLAQGIAKGHAFCDGNKRTAELAMLAFLRVNGYDLPVSAHTLKKWMLRIATWGTAEHLAERLRHRMMPHPPTRRPIFTELMNKILRGGGNRH